MATLTKLLGVRSGTGHGTGSYTTGSFTPSNNSLLVIFVWAQHNNANSGVIADTLTVSGGSLTYTSRVQAQDDGATSATWGGGIRCWTAPVTTGASMTITVDCGAIDIYNYSVHVFELTDYNTSTPVGATATRADETNSGSVSITLSGTPASDSYVLAAGYLDEASDTGLTTGTGWTQQYRSYADFFVAHTQARTGSTSTTVGWDNFTTSYVDLQIALEIKAAAASATSRPIFQRAPRFIRPRR